MLNSLSSLLVALPRRVGARIAGYHCASARAGFTLVEVLAALFLTGLAVTTILPFFVRLIGRAWSGESRMMMADQWMQATLRLSADIGQAIPISVAGAGQPSLAFRASSDQILLVRPTLSKNSSSELESVEFRIESGPKGDTIVRIARPFNKDSFGLADDAASSSVAILNSDARLRFKIVQRHADKSTNPGGKDQDKSLPSEIQLLARGVSAALPPIPFIFPIGARTSPVDGVSKGLKPDTTSGARHDQ